MLRSSGKKAVIRYPAYGILAIVFFALQTARFPGLSFWGATADLMPFIVAVLALFEGPYTAGIAGFLAGLTASLASPITEGVEALYLSVFGVVFAYLAEVWFSENELLSFLGGAAALLLFDILTYIFYYGLVYDLGLGGGIKFIFARLVLSAPGGALACFVYTKLARRMSERT